MSVDEKVEHESEVSVGEKVEYEPEESLVHFTDAKVELDSLQSNIQQRVEGIMELSKEGGVDTPDIEGIMDKWKKDIEDKLSDSPDSEDMQSLIDGVKKAVENIKEMFSGLGSRVKPPSMS